jgi:hypothetical protein
LSSAWIVGFGVGVGVVVGVCSLGLLFERRGGGEELARGLAAQHQAPSVVTAWGALRTLLLLLLEVLRSIPAEATDGVSRPRLLLDCKWVCCWDCVEGGGEIGAGPAPAAIAKPLHSD